MPRLLATMLSAVTIIGLGIVALSFRRRELASAGLTGREAEAFNLTREVSSGAMTILGQAYPWLVLLVVVVLVLLMLVIVR